MIPKYSRLVCFVGLFIRHIQSQDCTLLNVHVSTVTKENVRLLSSMSNPFPLRCLRDIKAFGLPQNIVSYSQPVERDIKEVFYDITIQALHIFSRHTSNFAGKEEYLTQIKIQVIQKSKLALRGYFKRIENYLKDKKYSYCAWKIVQAEIKRCFVYFLEFTKLLGGNKVYF
ncbi:interferon kappa [Fukomys damarensis]|uniref:interferon kappa n=1 Tax=Fukomys damarensis TaxID=885580 RepID=UPI001454FDD5|nr:interferon kappa [Fukomys damarensis]